MQPLISVIIPVYNHAARLPQSLLSLSRQTHRPLEVVVVDDGSTDDFVGAMQAVASTPWGKELQIKIIRQPNAGAAAARNAGLHEAAGDYVIFWDADTLAEKEMLSKMLAALEHHADASYAYCQYRFGWKKMKSQPFNANDLRHYNFVDTTSLIRRSAVVPFDPRLKRFQDWDLWLTMLQKNEFGVFIPEVLFTKVARGRKGISSWRPSFMYRLPVKFKSVKEYEAARQVIAQKHHLPTIGSAS